MYSQTLYSHYSSAASAPRQQLNLPTQRFADGGDESDEGYGYMEDVQTSAYKNNVTAGHDTSIRPAFGQDDMEAGLDVYLISNVANVTGNDIQFQNYVASEDYRGEINYPFDNNTVIDGYNTMLERDQTDVDADLNYILNMPPKVGEKVAGNKLQDNPVEATTDPLNNSTNTEQLNRSQKSDTPSTGENAPPVQHSASQRSGVDEDKPDAKGKGNVKGKGKAKAPAKPSGSGKRRKRTNSTEIHPDVGASKKPRVASADFPMPIMAVESSASAQIYTYASHVAAPQQAVGPIIPQATQYDQPFAYIHAPVPVMHQAPTFWSTEGFGSQFVSPDPYAEQFAYGQAPAPIMPQAPTYGSEDAMSSPIDNSVPYFQAHAYKEAMILQASRYAYESPYGQSFDTYTQPTGPIMPQASTSASGSTLPYGQTFVAGAYTQAPGPVMPQASTSASGSTRPRVPLFTAPTPQASTLPPSNQPSITGFERVDITVLSKLTTKFPNITVDHFYANRAIPDLETARTCPLCPIVVKLIDFEAHVEAFHSTHKCVTHNDVRDGVEAVTKDLLERHLNEYNLYCPYCDARRHPPLNRMREHFERCNTLIEMEAQKRAENEAVEEAKRQAALRNAYYY